MTIEEAKTEFLIAQDKIHVIIEELQKKTGLMVQVNIISQFTLQGYIHGIDIQPKF